MKRDYLVVLLDALCVAGVIFFLYLAQEWVRVAIEPDCGLSRAEAAQYGMVDRVTN